MAAMPQHDPVPPRRAGAPDYDRAADAWARYKKMMKWMLLAAALTVLAALAWLGSGDTLSIHMIIATTAGVGLSVLVGTGLMGLVFLSNRGGHDDAASGRSDRS
jgi:hypothetical protein